MELVIFFFISSKFKDEIGVQLLQNLPFLYTFVSSTIIYNPKYIKEHSSRNTEFYSCVLQGSKDWNLNYITEQNVLLTNLLLFFCVCIQCMVDRVSYGFQSNVWQYEKICNLKIHCKKEFVKIKGEVKLVQLQQVTAIVRYPFFLSCLHLFILSH